MGDVGKTIGRALLGPVISNAVGLGGGFPGLLGLLDKDDNKQDDQDTTPKPGMKKGGAVKTKNYASGGEVKMKSSSASKRGDGIAQRGRTRGKIV